jgi:hypothetical protein
MLHQRNRLILDIFQKKLKLSRVVAIQGCRQSGKSFFAKQILSNRFPASIYVTFDQKVQKTFAEENPESFLKKYSDAAPFIIDEAQKVPEIFDAIKFQVDQHIRPGQFVLLGSTEFSRLSKVRESLTGRMSRLRIYPLTLAECLELPRAKPKALAHLMQPIPRTSRKAVLNHFEKGGFPGIFAVRSQESRRDFFQDWLELTLHRDLHQFKGVSVETELASEIIQRIALLPEPNVTLLAKATKTNSRTVQRILNLLETLFVVHRLDPHREGNGKPLYFLCDVGLATHLGADLERQLWTWLLQEQLAQRGTQLDEGWKLFYFRSPKGKFIHLITENLRQREISALKILSTEKLDMREFEILSAFENRVQSEFGLVRKIAWGPLDYGDFKNGVISYPWESLC